jgi:hypothetical protein
MDDKTHLKRFIRQAEFKRLLGDPCKTEWYDMRHDGRVPEPDGWLSERVPFWTAETVAKTQANLLARPRPIETRPNRILQRKQDRAEAANG